MRNGLNPAQSRERGSAGRRTLSGVVKAAALIAPLLTVTACENHSKHHFTVGSVDQSYKTRHPIVIDEKEQVLDLPIGSSSYDLPRAQASAVEGFADRYKTNASGVITVMMPSGSPNEAAGRAMGMKVINILRNQGVANSRIRMASYHASQHGNSAPIRLSYMAVKAQVTGCGKWPRDLAAMNNQNRNYHNFGCASQSNVAAMISNPADLLGPRGTSEIDAQRRNTVIETYRQSGAGLGQ